MSALGTSETYGLGEIGSAFEVKPDIGPPLT
jgi:hypothetical protein